MRPRNLIRRNHSFIVAGWSFSKLVATRYLTTRRAEAFISIITVISVLGVAIGVMVLNIVMSVMTGFEHELREKIVGANSHVVVRRISGRIADWPRVRDVIGAVPGVSAVSAFTYNQALVRGAQQSVGVLIRGIEPGSAAAKQLKSYLSTPEPLETLLGQNSLTVDRPEGEGFSDVQLPSIIIGAELSRSLGLFPGEPVSLLSPNTASTPFGLVPQFRRFLVSAIYRSGLVEYESGVAYVNLSDAQKFFKLGDAISGFEILTDSVDEAPQVAQRIHAELSKLGAGFYAQPWTEANRGLWEAIQLEKRAYFVVLLLIVVMASFSIVATLVMIVLEKRRDIAVMMTLGASPKSIGRIFFIQGATIGLVGTVLGLGLGVCGCIALKEFGFPLNEQVFQMKELPVRMEPLNFVLVGACSFLICLLSTIYPARRASRLEPAEVLRYE